MDFKQFKKEWCDVMVYKTIGVDIDTIIKELHSAYEDVNSGLSVRQWCEKYHEHSDLGTHSYMLKSKALNTHHGNSLKQMANEFRKTNGLPLIPLIEKTKV